MIRFRAGEEGADHSEAPLAGGDVTGANTSTGSRDPNIPTWFILINEEQEGPLLLTKVAEMFEAAEINERTYAWREGMKDWLRLEDIDEFKPVLAERREAAPGGTSSAPERQEQDIPSLEPVGEPVVLEKKKRNIEPLLSEEEADGFYEHDADADVQNDTGAAEESQESSDVSGDAADAANPFTFLMVGEPTGETLGRGAVDVEARQSRLETDPGYFEAGPGESTRIFMQTAGIFRRRRINRIAAAISSSLLSLLISIGVGDYMGWWEAPGMGRVYESIGVEDSNLERAVARASESIQSGELTEEEKRAKQRRLRRLRGRLMGGSDGGGAKRCRGGNCAGTRKRNRDEKPVKENIELVAKKESTQSEKSMLGDIFGDSRKKEKGVALKPVEDIQTPDLPDGLTADSITEVINKNQNAMKLCIAQSMRGGGTPKGKMEVEMVIRPNGQVSSSKIVTTRFANSPIGKCTQKTVKRWRFPRFDGEPATVVFPYVLTSTL